MSREIAYNFAMNLASGVELVARGGPRFAPTRYSLKEGDDIEIHVADARALGVVRKPGREALLQRLRAFRGRLPPDSSSGGTRRMPGRFFDTSVLAYLASGDAAKADQAEAALATGGATSVQALNEIAHVARQKMKMSWCDTHVFLDMLRGLLTVHPISVESHETGLRLGEHYGFPLYDAMIAASAIHAGCDTLWSEDMQNGMVLEEGLRIANPFL